MSDLWERIEPLLASVERPSRYIDREWGATHDPGAGYRVALVYPDAYEVGMANQALQVLAARLRGLDDVAVERAFVPWVDMATAMRETDVPLFTLETCRPLAECDLVGITLPFELTYTNVCEVLDLAGIPLRGADRGSGDPIVIGGGPCAHNPEPMAPFFDAILVGDGEEAVVEIVAVHRSARERGATRSELLSALAGIEGVYVPSLYGAGPDGVRPLSVDAPVRVRRRVLEDLGSVPSPVCPVVPYADVVHDRVNVEVLRGCARGCRFCQAGMVYRPVRERPADDIVRDAVTSLRCTGYEEVSLTSLSTADHSQLADVLRRLARRLEGTAVTVSVPSLRVDSFTLGLARLLGGGTRGGLTLAPEAGTQRLRDVINKNVTEDEILDSVTAAFAAGWRRVKLYFMIGLPTETDDDVTGIAGLVTRVVTAAREHTPPAERGGIRVAVSVSTFVPKAHTPFQWEGQIHPDEVRRRQALLRSVMPRKGVELSWHDADASLLEGVLARGDRSVADVVEAAWRGGAVFDAWSEQFSLGRWLEAFAATGIDPVRWATRALEPGVPTPWAHIDSGLDERFLVAERERALQARTTADCTFEGCTGCGVCGALGVDNLIAGGDLRG
ncbi:MAG: TIGR03960 family B12-binding radical SAM protein [Coriobacteriia bacterium]|nr:TIGR03960 family B12-binding radical SAM protein [Coriobacteriia bacterium]